MCVQRGAFYSAAIIWLLCRCFRLRRLGARSSGVRPTKLSTKCLMSGGSEKDAERLLREVYFVSPERAQLCVDASRHTVEAAKLLDADDLSVYIGIPFCPTRCAYCSFVSQSIERFGVFTCVSGTRCCARSRIPAHC
ncbi:MAG: hypothetical protein V8T12_07410 [Parabacteroides johnsonii]